MSKQPLKQQAANRSSWIYLEKLAALHHSDRVQDQPVQRSFPRATPKEQM